MYTKRYRIIRKRSLVGDCCFKSYLLESYCKIMWDVTHTVTEVPLLLWFVGRSATR